MLVKLRENSFLSAGLFRVFNKLDYVSSWVEGWGADRTQDPGRSGRKRISTSSPFQQVGDPAHQAPPRNPLEEGRLIPVSVKLPLSWTV